MSEKNIYSIECEMEIAFARLIGPLAIMIELEAYKDIRNELLDLFKIVVKWGAEFQTKRNLGFVKSDELLNVYNRMDKIKEDYLYDGSIGTESELSDEIVIWMYEIMKLRKTLIEIEKIKYE